MDSLVLKEQLRNFLSDDGILTRYPSKYKLKILSLFYLASKFESDKKYTEKEVNELLKSWHSFNDCAMLRRDLFDSFFINREKDCSLYWLEEKQPTLQDFKLEL